MRITWNSDGKATTFWPVFGKAAGLAHVDLLLVDDWGLAPLYDLGRRDFLEILEDRHDIRSPIFSGQLPLLGWHEIIGAPTLAASARTGWPESSEYALHGIYLISFLLDRGFRSALLPSLNRS